MKQSLFFVMSTLLCVLSLVSPAITYAADCQAAIYTPTPATNTSIILVTVTQLDAGQTYRYLLRKQSPATTVDTQSTIARTGDPNIQFTTNLASKSASPGTYDLIVQNTTTNRMCVASTITITPPANEECAISSTTPPAGSTVTLRFKNSGYANQPVYVHKNWGAVSLSGELKQLDAQGAISIDFAAPSAADLPSYNPYGSINIAKKTGVISNADVLCTQQFSISAPPIDPPADCVVANQYWQCGATDGCLEGKTFPAEETVEVQQLNCTDPAKSGYRCVSLGKRPGECGNPIITTTVSCNVCPNDKPTYDISAGKCCSGALPGRPCDPRNSVAPTVEQCLTGVSCTPGIGCGKTSRAFPTVAPNCAKFVKVDAAGETIKDSSGKPEEISQDDIRKNPNVEYKCAEVRTAIGNINVEDASHIVKSLFTIILSLSGGVAILLFIYAGYTLMTSQGNPEKVQGAKDTITSAVIGLVFIIFSMVVLQVIGVDILAIPGFSQ